MLTQAHLKSLLRYNARTGHFVWLVNGRNRHQRAGKRAGCLDLQGRVKIGIEGKRYLASRLAFLYMTGRWPPVIAEHRNRDTSDNRWENLRPATSSENLHNTKTKRSGLKGVSPVGARFKAGIRVNYERKHLGYFDSETAAHAAYMAAARKYYGEFARAS